MREDTIAYRRKGCSECYMYATEVFPVTSKLVKGIKRMLEEYFRLKSVQELHSKCAHYTAVAKLARKGHVYVLANLKVLREELQQQADTLWHRVSELRDDASGLGDQAGTIKNVGNATLILDPILAPFDGGATTAVGVPKAGAQVYSDSRDTKAAKLDSEVELASYNAQILVNLVRSLEEYIEAVGLVAGFLSVLKKNLNDIEKRTGGGRDIKRFHLLAIKMKGQALLESCGSFIAVQRIIERDLFSIKDELEDGYAEKWRKGSGDFYLQVQRLATQ
jgi:hypothetical protein